MWIFAIKDGLFLRDSPSGVEVLCRTAYSGVPEAKNDPSKQTVPNVGPLPTGAYWIGGVSENKEHGPLAIRLIPIPQFAMYGRGGFLIHGDSIEHPGSASHGCIILPRSIRERLIASADRGLLVISSLSTMQGVML